MTVETLVRPWEKMVQGMRFTEVRLGAPSAWPRLICVLRSSAPSALTRMCEQSSTTCQAKQISAVLEASLFGYSRSRRY